MENKTIRYVEPSEREAENGIMSALLTDANAFNILEKAGMKSEMFDNIKLRTLYDIISTFHATNGRIPTILEVQRYLRIHHSTALTEADLIGMADYQYEDIELMSLYVKEAYVRRKAEKDLAQAVNMIKEPQANILSVFEWVKNRIGEGSSEISPPTNDQAEVDEWVYDTSQETEEPRYLITICNRKAIPERSITAITGKAKAGKSNFTMLLMSALVNKHHDSICGIRSLSNCNKILYIDTEQPKYAIQKKFRRMLKTAGYESNISLSKTGIQLLAMRAADVDKRLEVMRKAVMLYHPQLIVIDGIVDMCHDFNDIVLAGNLITELMQMTEQGITVVALLHENEGSAKMRGHLGTFLLQKCDDKFSVSSDNGQFKVKHLGRENLIPDLTFRIEDGIYTNSVVPVGDDKRDAITTFYRDQNKEILPQQELVRYLMSKFNASKTTAYRWLDNYTKGENPLLIYNKKLKVFKLLLPL